MSRSVTLIMKATRLCNLRCSYCYDWRADNQKMSFEVLAHTTAAVLRDPTHEAVTFVWHGGEPTLMGTEFFERAMVLQARFRSPGQVVRNVIQTNATRVTPEWASFLAKHRFGVGASIDGPPDIHDRTRTYVNGRPSWQDVRAGIRLLKEHGVDPSILMVVDRPVLDLRPRAVFDFFLEENIKRFGLLAAKPEVDLSALPSSPTDHYVTPAEMMSFLIEIDQCWLAHGDPAIRIREIENLRARIRRSGPRHCTLEGNCVGDYFLVEPTGEVAHCDLFLGDPAYTLGMVTEATFEEMRATPAAKALRRRNGAEVEAMASCLEFDTCNGWCPQERYISVRHNPEHDSGCCGQLSLIEHLRSTELEAERIETAAVLRPLSTAGG